MKEISSRQTRGLHFKFKLTKLHVDEDLYREARNAVQNLIWKKKKAYFEEKLKANTANPKKLWETLKELGLQNNITFLRYLSQKEEGFDIWSFCYIWSFSKVLFKSC